MHPRRMLWPVMLLASRRCGFAVLAGNDVAVWEMRGDSIAAEHVGDLWVKVLQASDVDGLYVGRRRVKRVVQIHEHFLAIVE